eukprot:jgi/Bigna1/91514/estExt_fgenesh1_pg.C_1030050
MVGGEAAGKSQEAAVATGTAAAAAAAAWQTKNDGAANDEVATAQSENQQLQEHLNNENKGGNEEEEKEDLGGGTPPTVTSSVGGGKEGKAVALGDQARNREDPAMTTMMMFERRGAGIITDNKSSSSSSSTVYRTAVTSASISSSNSREISSGELLINNGSSDDKTIKGNDEEKKHTSFLISPSALPTISRTGSKTIPSSRARYLSRKRPRMANKSTEGRLGVAMGENDQHCNWVGKVSDLSAHKSLCAFEKVGCRFAGCNRIVLRKSISSHENVCPHRRETQHEIMTCPESVTYCVHYEAGCKVPFKRKDEQNHYIHEAVNHAKLVQGSLSRMKHQIQELERTAHEAKTTLRVALMGGLAFQEGTEHRLAIIRAKRNVKDASTQVLLLGVDCRDHVGMWLRAQIVKKQRSQDLGVGGAITRLFVHFTNWDNRWDEWINPDVDSYRFAPPGFYTGGGNDTRTPYTVGEKVQVYITRPLPRQWKLAVVRKVHRQQIKVEYFSDSRRHEYWFHAKSMEIRGSVESAPVSISTKRKHSQMS